MSWHGPSLCAGSSVTLRDLVKFISTVRPSQLQGFPSVFSPSLRWFLSPVATREREFISNSFCRFLIPNRGTCGSDKSLRTSNKSLRGLKPQGWVCDNDVCLTLPVSRKRIKFLFKLFVSYIKWRAAWWILKKNSVAMSFSGAAGKWR